MNEELALFSEADLKVAVQDMRDLLSQNRLCFLIGAGCSKFAGLPLMPELTLEVLKYKDLKDITKNLLTQVSDSLPDTNTTTIEDYMSEIIDYLSIAERRSRCGASEPKIQLGKINFSADELQTALNDIKQSISTIINGQAVNVSIHQQFVQAIHGSLQSGKKSRTVDYFVLNYDTLFEDALGLEQIDYCDGFMGASTGWWDPYVFQADGKAARVFKIHGSIDWCLLENDMSPRRIRPTISTVSAKKHVLIYPAATKYQETQRNPFAQMFQYMRESICPKEKQETILVICGYGFGDLHIDLEIENALYQSEGRLTIAALVSTDKPEGKLRAWLEDPLVSEQVRVYTNKGYYHGPNVLEKETDIPWWKFEILARLLEGER